MAIYRGSGGSGDATNDASISAVTALTIRAEDASEAAASSASAAASSASAAAGSEAGVAASAAAAASSASAASTSATNAASSASTASTQATNAANSATAAATSATNAANSATASASSATDAQTAQTAAETAETNAATSASNAASSASSASSSASTATTQATNAASSASSASTSASNAASSASAANSSAVSAANSAAAAATALDNFDDRYLGAKTSDPTVDNDGDPLVTGALYFNSTDGVMKIYDGASWIETSSASVGTMAKFNYTATGGQTVFSGADDNTAVLSLSVGAEIVTLNGVVLEQGTDYTATASAVTLTSGATAGDEVNIYAFGNFTVADVVPASTGGTFQSNVVVNGNLDAQTFTQNGSPLEAGAKEGVFWENSQTVTTNYTITSNKNAGTFGPITINSGVSVTIPSGSRWVIV
jgi:chemotaxis protein histidine kinase CheA